MEWQRKLYVVFYGGWRFKSLVSNRTEQSRAKLLTEWLPFVSLNMQINDRFLLVPMNLYKMTSDRRCSKALLATRNQRKRCLASDHRQIYRRASACLACAYREKRSRMLIWCSYWIRTSHLLFIRKSRGLFTFIAHPPSQLASLLPAHNIWYGFGFVHSIYLLLLSSLVVPPTLVSIARCACVLQIVYSWLDSGCSKFYDRFTC